MRWITSENINADGAACVWLIKRFVDDYATFHFVPSGSVMQRAEELDAIPFNVSGVRYGPKDGKTTFDSFLEWYGIKELGMKRLADAVRSVVQDVEPKDQFSASLRSEVNNILQSKKSAEIKINEVGAVLDAALDG